MMALKAAFRLPLSATLIAVTAPLSAAEQAKCSTVEKYAGPAPISIALPSAESASPEPMPVDREALSVLFADMFARSKAASMTVALANHSGPIWTETQGLEDKEQLHYWASVGKSYTAIVIMQLVEEGRLSLDDKLANWIADVPNGDLITVEMLLNHTSGLYSTNEDPSLRTNGPKPLNIKDNVEILKRHGAPFCPGQNWRYSNTGYLFLGTIAEQVDGQRLSQIIQTRIIDKIGLSNTRMVDADDDVSDVAKPRPSDKQKSDIRTPGPAGPIAATSTDLILFWRAFLDGKLVKPETRDKMFAELFPMFDKNTFYGLGVMAMRAPGKNGEPALWIGHAGGMPGMKAFVMIDPVNRQYASVALTGDGPASAVAYNMLQQWQNLLAP
ncbi:serine hydrolase domain-containing protein [Parasphingorhabdus sp.]|uniref:serine hydrolase domain-containing protein n=1 Tax=Parasphingorhabdus sp. TaxID=2709688 RepID=UPI003BAE7B0E